MEGSGNHNGNKGRQADVVYVQELSKGLTRVLRGTLYPVQLGTRRYYGTMVDGTWWCV